MTEHAHTYIHSYNYEHPHERKRETVESEKEMIQQNTVMGKGHEPGKVGSLQKLEKARNGFTPRVSRRNIAFLTP